MKNTKKTLTLGIVALLLIVGLTGGTVALISRGLKEASDILDDATDKNSNVIPDSEQDTTPPDTDPWADGKLSYADGEIYVAYQPVNDEYYYISFFTEDIEVGKTYELSWQFKSTYTTSGAKQDYQEVDGIMRPFFTVGYSANTQSEKYLAYSDKESDMLRGNIICDQVASERFIILHTFRIDSNDEAYVRSVGEAFKQHISYFEIREVTI